ncbi:BnaA05g16110D [Brassica napus]|uniref:BnaA05g16110D protein n=2 Tax=Brassica TaxID=3705 RepID=A0A078GW02_BRANA|nr:BnaA05g16110D [Brassica napus]
MKRLAWRTTENS